METLQEKYHKEIIQKLREEFQIQNIMAVPKLVKIVVNCGLGEAIGDKKVLEKAAGQLGIITGQKMQVTRAKKAISSFKLRAGDAIGLRATLRGNRMYIFFTKLVGLAIPRIRDFHGVPNTGFDGAGNYTLGFSEQTIFPELEYSMIDRVRGFEVTFVIKNANDTQAKRLLELLGLPFEK
ncbi:50S ribosomal protein L5 [Candidatus Gottesmanbacteria bacterium]|nr:50S ribosomal protein L5 [Candidatus Gottesmanbacteria bacterium]